MDVSSDSQVEWKQTLCTILYIELFWTHSSHIKVIAIASFQIQNYLETQTNMDSTRQPKYLHQFKFKWQVNVYIHNKLIFNVKN